MTRFRSPSSLWSLAILVACVTGLVGMPQPAVATSATPGVLGPGAANHYVGADKCKNCHKSEAGGDQYTHWTESRHSHAYEVLASDLAKEQATKLGVEDPQKSDKCLKCHVTGFGEPEDAFAKGFKLEQGVQCETCHGQGETHMKARFAAAAKAKGGTPEPPAPGEINANPTAETCVGCHNKESPNYKGFCWKTFSKKIRHLDPRIPKTDEQKAALEADCECGETCACDHAAGKDCGK